MTRPGIILTSQFDTPNQPNPQKPIQSFADYISYLKRTEALHKGDYQQEANIIIQQFQIENFSTELFEKYMNYMTRNKAVKHDKENEFDGVFTADHRIKTKAEVKAVQRIFQSAQDNQSILWKDVVSFDNDFLVKEGIYHPETGVLDDDRLIRATRKMMEKLENDEALKGLYWLASIHRNTDNIHIHIASVERHPSRPMMTYNGKRVPRGKRKLSSIDHMKTTFGNELLNLSPLYIQISKNRDRTLEQLKIYAQTPKIDHQKIINALKHRHALPKNWEYQVQLNHVSYQSLSPQGKAVLDKTIHHLETKGDLASSFIDYSYYLDQVNHLFQRLYGERENPQATIKAKRLDDLNERLGNILLKNLGSYQRQQNKRKKAKKRYYPGSKRFSPLKKEIHYRSRRWEYEGLRLLNNEMYRSRKLAEKEYEEMMWKVEQSINPHIEH